jgi:hypothetical protein
VRAISVGPALANASAKCAANDPNVIFFHFSVGQYFKNKIQILSHRKTFLGRVLSAVNDPNVIFFHFSVGQYFKKKIQILSHGKTF